MTRYHYFVLAALLGLIMFAAATIVDLRQELADFLPDLPLCAEDSEILLLGRGDYVGGKGWDSYKPICIHIDDFYLDPARYPIYE